MAHILTIASEKGGVGKSMSAVNLSAAFAKAGKRVVLIDFDVANTIANWFDLNYRYGIAHILLGQCSIQDAVVAKPFGFDVVPSGATMLPVAVQRIAPHTQLTIVQTMIEPLLSRYDIVVMDTPPGQDPMKVSVYVATQWVVIPTTLDKLGTDGMVQEMAFLIRMRGEGYPIACAGVLPTMVEQTREQQTYLTQITAELGQELMLPAIRKNARLRELPRVHQAIYDYDSTSPAAADYRQAATTILNKMEGTPHE